MTTYPYRVTGDHMRLVYSHHRTLAAALRACRALTRKWGWSHPGAEPLVEQDTPRGWRIIKGDRA
ncbi:MAG TPA: hypothetical protein VGJ80_06265 [Gemmatimonadales bacterium]|jgi:hypothetical protein